MGTLGDVEIRHRMGLAVGTVVVLEEIVRLQVFEDHLARFVRFVVGPGKGETEAKAPPRHGKVENA